MQFVGAEPDLDEDAQIVFEDDIRKEDLVAFESRGDGTVAIKHAGPESSGGEVYRLAPESTSEALVFVRKATGIQTSGPQDASELQRLLEETFSGVGFFYRDTDVADELLSNYHPGMTVKERAYVDCSYLSGGLAAKHRYLIITSKARDLHAMAGMNRKYGPAIIMRDSFFKVLDVHQLRGHSQITLLHLPEELVERFTSTKLIGPEKRLAEAARKEFEENLRKSPCPYLTDPYWLDRVSFPIGMSDEGELF